MTVKLPEKNPNLIALNDTYPRKYLPPTMEIIDEGGTIVYEFRNHMVVHTGYVNNKYTAKTPIGGKAAIPTWRKIFKPGKYHKKDVGKR
jgi:hypothetical protein